MSEGQATPAPSAPAAAGSVTPAAAPQASWYDAQYAEAVTAKGWKSPNDALKSYVELEKFRGAPADRLLVLPDKPDAPEWAEVRKKVGWVAPEKPEDYGLQPAEGFSPEYAQAITKAAHEAGIPKDALLKLAAANDGITKQMMEAQAAEQERITKERFSKADSALKEKFGDKLGETQELMTREARRLGVEAAELEEIETALASVSEKALPTFRAMLADVARARREAPLVDGQKAVAVSKEQAAATLAAKRNDPAWRQAALTRGTPEAIENLKLNAAAMGATLSDEEATRQALGLGPKSGS